MPPKFPHVRSLIPGYRKSVALLSSANVNDVAGAVVFVHGYSGAARSTWTDFFSLIDHRQTSAWWENRDVYFYHYCWDSVFREISSNANSVLGFLQVLFPSPPRELFEVAEMTIRNDFVYRELTLVGHSEGGLLLRKVILEVAGSDPRLRAYRQNYHRGAASPPQPVPDGLENANLRLFAPAIGGETLTRLLGILANLPVIGLLTHASAAKKGLAPTSPSVTETRKDTNRYADILDMPCFQAHVLWADKDAVVIGENYRNDKACRNRPRGTNHSSICKPKDSYRTPLTFVERGVINGQC